MKRSVCFLPGLWLTLLLALSLAACGGGAATVAPTAPPAPAPTQRAALPSAAAKGRDLAAIRVCEIVTPDEVAAIAGGNVDQEALQSNTATSAVCVYSVRLPNGDYQQYRVHFQPANLVEPLFACCAVDLGQPVEGFGDVAFLKRDDDAGTLTLVALVRSDFALEVIATAAGEAAIAEEVLRQLAGALLGRLP